MKKKLESELISIAHKILQLGDNPDLSKLQQEARNLYEKLTILNFSESHFLGPQPTIGQIEHSLQKITPYVHEEASENIISELDISVDEVPKVADLQKNKPTTIETKVHAKQLQIEEKKPEIIIEKINEKISEDLFVPASTVTTEDTSLFSAPTYKKNDKGNIGTDTESIAIIDSNKNEDIKSTSLNDQLKKGIHIGLNDRLSFIKHLFNGSSADYNRVLSQLNTLNSKSGAKQFIKNMVKPDYNDWKDKEEYEGRFMEIVMNKFTF